MVPPTTQDLRDQEILATERHRILLVFSARFFAGDPINEPTHTSMAGYATQVLIPRAEGLVRLASCLPGSLLNRRPRSILVTIKEVPS